MDVSQSLHYGVSDIDGGMNKFAEIDKILINIS